MPRTVWYPGHMAKGTRRLFELAGRLDVIVEVRDSRAPASTSSPLMKRLAKMKPIIRVFSRKDLADPEKLALWLDAVKFSYPADLRKREGLTQIRRAIMRFKPSHREARIAVAGIPNVGKSLLLNILAGKSSAKVANVPGVTKSVSWYKSGDILIVDSPGILDPHAEPGAHMMLSWLGCAKAEIVGGWENAAISLINFLTHNNMAGMIPADVDEIPALTLENIGRKFGCLITGGRVNMELAGQKLIEAFSSGRLGRVCLEIPGGERAVDFSRDEAANIVS